MRTSSADFLIPTPTNDDDLWEATRLLTGVKIPRVQICDNHVAPFTAFADAFFARHSMTVWKGSRGLAGKSHLLSLLGWSEQVWLGARVTELGGSLEQSRNIHNYQQQFWSHRYAPRDLLMTDPTARAQKLRNGAWSSVLTASQKSVRSPHPERARLDEVDEMNLAIYDAAQGQTLATRGIPAQTVASSTHQYPNGTMTEVLKRAARRGWPVYEWCYRESLEPHGWLTQSEVDRKRAEVSEEMWRVEYELGEASTENRAINTELVEAMFDSAYELEEPVKGALYVHGADWAKKQDETVIVTLRVDTSPARLVAYQHMNRRPWPVMIRAFDEQVQRYQEVAGPSGAEAAHDATGIGDVIDDYIAHDAEAIILAGKRRTDLLSDYVIACEQGMIRAPRIDHPYSAHKYATVGDLYGHGSDDHCPDPIMAMAVAWSIRAKARKVAVPAPLSMTGLSRWR